MRPLFAIALGIALAACGPKGLKEHMARSEKVGDAFTDDLDAAERALDAVNIEKAERFIEEARGHANDPDMVYNPEREMYRDRLATAEARLETAKAIRAKQILDAKVKEQSEKLEKAADALRAALGSLDNPEVDAKALDEAHDRAEDLDDALKDGASLEPQDAGYAAAANKRRKLAAEAKPRIEIAAKVVAFVEGPIRSLLKGQDLAEKARAASAAEESRELYADAAERFQECVQRGRSMLADHPTIAKQSLLVGGSARAPKSVVATCEAEAKASQKALAKPVKGKAKPAAKKKPGKKKGK